MFIELMDVQAHVPKTHEHMRCVAFQVEWALAVLNLLLASATADLVGYGSLRQSPCLKGSALAMMEGGRGMCLTAD